jgi:rhamnogalacturonan endolyase
MAHVPGGTATLRLAICGSRGNSVDVMVNGKLIGGTGTLPNSGVMHRDGIRSVESEVDLPFDSSLLVQGANEIELKTNANDWTQGVLFADRIAAGSGTRSPQRP